MSMSDPIADLLTRIRNAQMVSKATVSVPSSKVKIAIAQVLKDEGYIDGFEVKTEAGKSELQIALKYYAGRPVIERIERVSRPGLRVYKGRDAIPQVMNGLGVAIVNPYTAQACAGPQLVVRPLAFAIPYQVHVLLPLHRPSDMAVQWLVAALQQQSQHLATE